MTLEGEDFVALQELLTHVPVAEPLMTYAASLLMATHPETSTTIPSVARFVSYGASPRGMQAMIRAARAYCLLDGRTAVSVDDIRRVAAPALRHRIIMNFEGEAEQVKADDLVAEILDQVPTPAKGAA